MTKQKKKLAEDQTTLELRGQTPGNNFNPFELRGGADLDEQADSAVHVLAPGIVCDTDTRGYATPQNQSPTEIMVDATEGFIPLWEPNRVLRWQFNARSMRRYQNPNATKRYIRQLMTESMLAWGDAAPIRFKEVTTSWDFEIELTGSDKCSLDGCTLASAFFPDSGRQKLKLYPKLFDQSRKEQVDTFIHELGHIFGLRHFFADVDESKWPSELFGEHRKFSIMNYGKFSELTDRDKADLKALYHGAWNGCLQDVNGTPIVLFTPYHYAASWRYPSMGQRI